MSTIAELEREVMQLPEDQRVALVHRVLEGVEPASEAGIQDAWNVADLGVDRGRIVIRQCLAGDIDHAQEEASLAHQVDAFDHIGGEGGV